MTWLTSIDESRSRSTPGSRAGLADEPRQRVAGLAVAEAAEVDAGEDDLAVALRDAALDLAEHRVGAAAARRPADERDHAEGAREAAAVLDLHERARPVEPRVGLDAADRADVAGDGVRQSPRSAARRPSRSGQAGEGAVGGSRRSRSRRRGRGVRAAREAAWRDFETASCVTQHVLTTATSPAARDLGVAVARAGARAPPARRRARPCSRGSGRRTSPSRD